MTDKFAHYYDDSQLGRNSARYWIIGFVIFWAATKLFPYFLTALNSALKYVLAGGPGGPILKRVTSGEGIFVIGAYIVWIAPILAAIWYVQVGLRQRPVGKLINVSGKFRWKRAIAAAFVYILVGVILWGVFFIVRDLKAPNSLLFPEDKFLSRLSNPWLGFDGYGLILSLIFMPVYFLCQEMIFRGFVDQGLSRLISKKAQLFIISGVIYGLWNVSLLMLIGFPDASFSIIILSALGVVLTHSVVGALFSWLCFSDNGIEAVVGLSIVQYIYFEFIARHLLLMATPDGYFDTGKTPIIFMVHSLIYIPAILALLVFKFGLKPNGALPKP